MSEPVVSKFEVCVVFEAMRVTHPGEGLSMGSSWLFELQRLVEGIDNADEEVLPQLLHVLLLAGLAPLNRRTNT